MRALAIRRYATGQENHLEVEIQRLLRERRDADRRYYRTKIDAKLRVITDFRENVGDEAPYHISRRFAPLSMNGVRISTEPTLSGALGDGRYAIPATSSSTAKKKPRARRKCGMPWRSSITALGERTRRPRAAANLACENRRGLGTQRPSIRRWRDVEAACREIALRGANHRSMNIAQGDPATRMPEPRSPDARPTPQRSDAGTHGRKTARRERTRRSSLCRLRWRPYEGVRCFEPAG